MSIWQAIFLAIVQGFTEFLPISSSGHLAILQNWMQIPPSIFYFDIFLHFVSVIVIIYYFRQAIFKVNKQTVVNLIIATLPLLLIGYLFKDWIKLLFSSNTAVGIGLLITAALNFYTWKKYKQLESSQPLNPKKSFWIGLSQIFALLPGISRSGSTLFGASMVEVDKSTAFEFSFLLAVPAILAANFAELLTIGFDITNHFAKISLSNYIAGGLACLIISFMSLELLKITFDKTKYHFFGWYCLIMGCLAIFSTFI